MLRARTASTATIDIRGSAVRWKALGNLVKTLDRLVQANARLDVAGTRRSGAWRLAEAEELEKELAGLGAQIEAECTRLTIERLRVDLAERQRKDAR